MNDYIEEENELVEPHPFTPCREAHLIPREDEHCAWPSCGADREHPIHRTAKERAA